MRDEIIRNQVALLEADMGMFVARGERYALVDFPDHSNVGDSAIWLGDIRLLGGITGRDPDYVCTWNNYDPLELARSRGPIFIHGGGNFGDLYPHHQRFRLRLMAEFPDRVIVQLPQSLHFDKPKGIEETAKAISRHGGFHLFVRDEPSKVFAEQNFDCPVKLVPDCAFALGSLKPTRRPEHPILCLLRTDGEQAGIDYAPLATLSAPVRDWLTEAPLPKVRGVPAIAAGALRGKLSRQSARLARYNSAAGIRMRRGVDLLSSAETIITDRLHGHILSILLGIPDVAFDNRTGKVSGYHRQWLSGLERSVVVDDATAAVRAVAQLQRAKATG